MAQPQKEPLRALSEQEERELKRLAKATSERLDVVWRAKALAAVASGQPFTEAAREAGLKSGAGVGKLVKRRECTWSLCAVDCRRGWTQADLHE